MSGSPRRPRPTPFSEGLRRNRPPLGAKNGIGAIVVVVVAALLVVGCGSSSTGSAPTSGPLRSNAPLTAPAPSSSTSASTAPQATSTTRAGNPDGPVVVPDGALLTPIDPPPGPVPFPGGTSCLMLPNATAANDAPYPCGAPGAGTGTAAHPGLAWVLAPNGKGGRTLTVYRVIDGRAQAVLAASDPDGTAWSTVTPEKVQLTGLPDTALAVGFRANGSAGQLQVDVVDAGGTVAFHREVDQGQASVSDGQYEDWAARFAADDPNCCPSAYEHSVVRDVAGKWRVVIDETVPPSAVPKGQFP